MPSWGSGIYNSLNLYFEESDSPLGDTGDCATISYQRQG